RRRRHTIFSRDWSSDVCSSDLAFATSWLLVLGYITVVAFEAVALPESLSYLIPGLESARLWSVAGSDVHGMWVLVGVVGAVVMRSEERRVGQEGSVCGGRCQ